MPRTARDWTPGDILHVSVRGHCGARILAEEEDRHLLIHRGKRAFDETGASCLGWSILDNHYHVLARCVHAPGTTFLRLNTSLGKHLARRRGELGAVFQGRYFSGTCENDGSLLSRFAYVLGNPLHHGVVRSVAELMRHPWSSLGEILGLRPSAWTDVDYALSLIDPNPAHARRTLLDFLEGRAAEWASRAGRPDALDRFKGPTLANLLLGVERPAEGPASASPCVCGLPATEGFTTDVPTAVIRNRLRGLGWTVDRLIDPVCSWVACDPQRVRSGARTRAVVEARSVVAYVACDVAGSTMVAAAPPLGVDPSSLVGARRRGRSILADHGIAPDVVLGWSLEIETRCDVRPRPAGAGSRPGPQPEPVRRVVPDAARFAP